MIKHSIFLYLALAAWPTAADETNVQGPLVVYTAKNIITMEPALPSATAVAVADGRIVAVGDLKSLKSWIDQKDARIDTRFADKVIMPGFIDPHVHPSLPAVLTQFPFIAPDDWSLPTGEFPGAKTPKAYLTRLKAASGTAHRQQHPFYCLGLSPSLAWAAVPRTVNRSISRDTRDAVASFVPRTDWQRRSHGATEYPRS